MAYDRILVEKIYFSLYKLLSHKLYIAAWYENLKKLKFEGGGGGVIKRPSEGAIPGSFKHFDCPILKIWSMFYNQQKRNQEVFITLYTYILYLDKTGF